MNRPDPRLEDLIVRHFEGLLDSAEEKELATRLSESSEARACFAAYMREEGAAGQLATASCLSGSASPIPRDATRREPARASRAFAFTVRNVAWAAAAGFLLAASITFFILVRRSETPALALARVSRLVDVHWTDVGLPIEAGSTVGPGKIELESGLVQLDFESGVEVVLEGPAEFDIVSTDRAFCHRGKLRSFVPPGAEGFTIDTAEMKIIDRGTEFGLRIDESGNTEVHVFNGAVELHEVTYGTNVEGVEHVQAGDAVQFVASGKRLRMPARDDDFVSPTVMGSLEAVYVNDLKRRLETLQARQKSTDGKYQTSRERLTRDERLVALGATAEKLVTELARYEQADPEIVRTQRAVEQALAALNARTEEKLQVDRDAVAVRETLRTLETRLSSLKKQKSEARRRKARGEVRAIDAKAKETVERRRGYERELRALRSQLQKRDPELKAAAARCAAARKEAARVPGLKKLRPLKRAARKAQDDVRARRKELMQQDDVLGALRAERTLLSMRIRDMKRRIREARVSSKERG